MSSEDEGDVICAVCAKFEPQAWRKKFCKNCFHSIDEHSTGGENDSGNEKIDSEKSLKRSDEKEAIDSKTEKSVKDKITDSNQSKVDKPTPDTSLKDKSSSKSDKTSALADKISKKLSGSAPTDKTPEKHEVKKTATNNLKSKFEAKSTEPEKQSDKKIESTPKTTSDKTKVETSTVKDSDKNKVNDTKSDINKTKSWGSKSKFETKEKNDEKTKTNDKDEKDSSSIKEEQTSDSKKPKFFKPPPQPDTKLKWHDSWGPKLSTKKDENKEKVEEKAKNEKQNVAQSTKDSLKAKFESKDTGTLWGAKNQNDKKAPDDKNKENVGKTVSSTKDDVNDDKTKTSENKLSTKFGDKFASKFGDKITTKEPEKSKFGDKSTDKEPEKSKPSDKVETNGTDKLKFGDKNTTKEPEKSKFGDKNTTKEPEKSKFGDKLLNKDPQTSKFGDKFTNKEPEKSKFGDKISVKDSDKKLSDKLDSKSKTEDEQSKLDNKSALFGAKSKFEKFSDNKETNLKKTDQKSESDNKKNEKIEEGKLKLDIKAANVNKMEKDSIADRMKEKYEKISKTPTSTIPSKTKDTKVYTRSKSDGATLGDKPSDILSPKIKTSDSIGREMTKQPKTDDKTSESSRKEAKSPVIKHTPDQDQDHSSTGEEVKESETPTSLPKLNTDEINKIKEAAKFLLDDDFDDVRYNSLGRRNKEKSQQATTASLSSAESEADDPIQGKNKTVGKEKKVEDAFNEKFSSETEKLKKQLKLMEERCAELEEENKKLKNGLSENEKHSGRLMKQKQDVDNSIKALQKNLTSIESKCAKLETENAGLIEQIKVAKAKCDGNEVMDLKEAHLAELELLRKRLKSGEDIVDALRDDNETLRQEIIDLKGEMEEMYDTFRDQEADEFRDVQREMEMHAKNCRVLSFKLRKYERVNEQLEAEKENLEDKIQALQNQISDGDTRAHIRDIEDELRLAKEVSVRLHDELDILEEKKCKSEEENAQLTQILEQSDKKQFRLEMELDKLRDQVAEMKKKLADKSTPGTPVSQDDIKDRRF